MARPTKPELFKEMMEKIESIRLLTQEITAIHDFSEEGFKESFTIMDISDSLGDLSDGEDALYIIRSKLGKD